MNDVADTETLKYVLLEEVAEVIAAYVANNSIPTADLPALIASTYGALRALSETPIEQPVADLKPAVPIRKSVTPDFIICLDDGMKFKSMKRHVAGLGMTPDEYRAKWDLPSDYPMSAPNYSALRSSMAKSNGLGRKPGVRLVVPAQRTKKPKSDA
ncbi:MAG: MucR family transcriptional regulator [Devosia sp.]